MLLIKDGSDPHPFDLQELLEDRFDLRGFNAVSTDLYHFVGPAGDDNLSVRLDRPVIPRADTAVQTDLLRELGKAEITPEIRRPITEIPRFPNRKDIAAVIHDIDFRFMLPDSADRCDVIFPVNKKRRDIEAGFRLTVPAEDFHPVAENFLCRFSSDNDLRQGRGDPFQILQHGGNDEKVREL